MILQEQTHRGVNTGRCRDIAECLFLIKEEREVDFFLILILIFFIWQMYADNLSL